MRLALLPLCLAALTGLAPVRAADAPELPEFRKLLAGKALQSGNPKIAPALLALEEAGFLAEILDSARAVLGGSVPGQPGQPGQPPAEPPAERLQALIATWKQSADLAYNTPTSYEDPYWARPTGPTKILKILPPRPSVDGSVPTWSVQISIVFHEYGPGISGREYDTNHYWLAVDVAHGQVLQHQSVSKDQLPDWLK